ncbi:hypothetical protein TSOC_009986 [Tetrabaena socialis]|uniref:Uncharacterized protein n=1 Tax=Tetrabaena socialis TaxID=47790 RepID=A0A2J7ZUG1_9CHLO|nr:hypothetical protein TSOC_009986 [Tetrabaena socialis]|eukprot:PNH03902.1 hypothetical protein TSOC_009986 [Tetrabaena socialis]
MAWFAILITILAASGNNIGKVLQKQATRTLPRLVLNRATLLLYLRSALWLTGMLVDLGGALLMIVAFAYAPVVRLASWLCILLGVSCLAGGTEALAATARALAACAPPWALRLLPRPMAVSVHRLQKKRSAIAEGGEVPENTDLV